VEAVVEIEFSGILGVHHCERNLQRKSQYEKIYRFQQNITHDLKLFQAFWSVGPQKGIIIISICCGKSLSLTMQ
jgi:hypothetical protein